MKVWAENVGFATKTWKIGSLGFAIVRLSFGYRSLSFAYRLLSFAIVLYHSLTVRDRSPIVGYRSPIVHVHPLFANRSLSFTKFPVFVRLQFVAVPVSAIFCHSFFFNRFFQPRPKNLDFLKNTQRN